MNHRNVVFAIVAVMLTTSIQAFAEDVYFQFGSLNHGAVDVGSSWTRLDTGTHVFTKNQDDTEIEVHLNSRFRVTAMEANGVMFQVRIDDEITPDYDNMGSIRASDPIDVFLSIYAVFKSVLAGDHSVSIWAKAFPTGNAYSVVADPGGWGGRLILELVDDAGVVAAPQNGATPERHQLSHPHPNPFNPRTTIDFSLETTGDVDLHIYDISGRMVRHLVDTPLQPGIHHATWDGRDESGLELASGTYFYRLSLDGKILDEKKAVILK